MNEVIIYQANDGVCIVAPADCGLSVVDIGKKDVPAGVNFWVVDISNLPRSPIDAWELDMDALGSPDGVGGTFIPEEKNND